MNLAFCILTPRISLIQTISCTILYLDGTAPMAEFADVFDPAGDPQRAMVGMMQVRMMIWIVSRMCRTIFTIDLSEMFFW